jgi:hypothetical protein
VSRILRVTDRYNLAVGLNKKPMYVVVEPVEIGENGPTIPESSIERPICVVTDQRKIRIRRIVAGKIDENGNVTQGGTSTRTFLPLIFRLIGSVAGWECNLSPPGMASDLRFIGFPWR